MLFFNFQDKNLEAFIKAVNCSWLSDNVDSELAGIEIWSSIKMNITSAAFVVKVTLELCSILTVSAS